MRTRRTAAPILQTRACSSSRSSLSEGLLGSAASLLGDVVGSYPTFPAEGAWLNRDTFTVHRGSLSKISRAARGAQLSAPSFSELIEWPTKPKFLCKRKECFRQEEASFVDAG